jgi:hypothetical protein
LDKETNREEQTKMNTEGVLFKFGDIVITNTRFIVGSQTFAIRNITSVRVEEIEPNYSVPGSLMFFGIVASLLGIFGGIGLIGIFGLVMLAVGIYLAWQLETTYAVLLTTSSGEVNARLSEDKQFIEGIVKGLNDAIIALA